MNRDDFLFGSYHTMKFTDFYNSADEFVSDYNGFEELKLPYTQTDSEKWLKTIFYLLYGQYGNSHISNMDTFQFKTKLFSTIYMYAPVWIKKKEIQEKLVTLEEGDFLISGTNIHNHSYNPNSEPSTQSTLELETVNEQNVTKLKRSKLEGYSQLYNLLNSDVTKEFLNKFSGLFLKIVEPQMPLWYITELDEGDE